MATLVTGVIMAAIDINRYSSAIFLRAICMIVIKENKSAYVIFDIHLFLFVLILQSDPTFVLKIRFLATSCGS